MLNRPSLKRKRCKGNTLFEYILIGSGLIMLSMVGLQLLAGNLNLQFGVVKDDMRSRIALTAQQSQKAADEKSAFEAAESLTAETLQQSGLDISGMSIDEISNIIQTSGANGATELLASYLDSYIEQLRGEGTMSEEQLNILQKLANAGHDLAKAEKALDDAVKSGQGTVTHNGETMTVDQFKEQLGFNNTVGIDAASSMDAGSSMSLLSPFMNIYNEAQASGAVNGEVNTLSVQIAALSDLAKWNTGTDSTNLSYAYVTAMQQVGISDTAVDVSEATHGNSGQICNAGSGSDTGTQCN